MVYVNSAAFEAAIKSWYSVVDGIDPRECDGVPVPPMNLNTALAAAITAYEAAKPSEWLPIESAPKDGSIIWVIFGGCMYFGSYRHGRWEKIGGIGWELDVNGLYLAGGAIEPTHWQPLPTPPIDTPAPHDNFTP